MEINYEHRLTEVEIISESNTRRLEEVEKRQDNLDELVSTVRVLAEREKRVEDDISEIKVDVKNLTNKPAQKWDGLVNQIITLIVAAVVGFILAKIGL